MTSSLRRALPPLLVLSLTLACAACAGGPRTTTILAALDCGSLIGPELRRDVAGADLPIDGSVGAWVAFGDAQTGRLDQANGNTRAVVQTVDACDRQQAAVREALEPRPWHRRLFGGGKIPAGAIQHEPTPPLVGGPTPSLVRRRGLFNSGVS